jgi:hypothetical protein
MTLGVEHKMERPWFKANNMSAALFAVVEDHDSAPKAELPPGARRLGWFILPPFQRPAVWSEAQKVRFIESIWGGLPLGSYVYNRGSFNSPYDNWLLDGQQRITAILEYHASAFPVLGYRWDELTKVDHRRFLMTPMSCSETNIEDLAKLEEIYDRLAYGGTAHAPKGDAYVGEIDLDHLQGNEPTAADLAAAEVFIERHVTFVDDSETEK